MTHERNPVTQPREIDLYIRSDRRTAIAHSGPYKSKRFIRVGGTHWMLAGPASPAEQEEAAKHAIGAGGVGPMMGRTPPLSPEAVIQMAQDAAVLGNIESPFNACMHQDHCKAWKSQASAATIQSGGITPGWKLVPEAHTLDMSIAFGECFYSKHRACDDDDIQDIWDALLAAAPHPPQVAQKPVGAQSRFNGEADWTPCSVEHHLLVQANQKDWPGYETRALYTRPQPPKVEQEPYIWYDIDTGATFTREDVDDGTAPASGLIPLYDKPQPKRDPLTKAEIYRLEVHPMMTITEVVRVVERAHEIGGGE